MTITLPLTPELEQKLRTSAAAAGVSAESFVLDALTDRLEHGQAEGKPLPPDEANLLKAINQGLPEATWRRYHELVARRADGTLTEQEHKELLDLTDQIEIANARRMKSVVELADLRHVTVEQLMDQLGIRDPGHV